VGVIEVIRVSFRSETGDSGGIVIGNVGGITSAPIHGIIVAACSSDREQTLFSPIDNILRNQSVVPR